MVRTFVSFVSWVFNAEFSYWSLGVCSGFISEVEALFLRCAVGTAVLYPNTHSQLRRVQPMWCCKSLHQSLRKTEDGQK